MYPFGILGVLIFFVFCCLCCVFVVNKVLLLHESFELFNVVENAFEWLYSTNGVYKVFLVQLHFWLLRYEILILFILGQVELIW